MKRHFALSLVLVALFSAAVGFALAQYTSAIHRTAAAPAPADAPAPAGGETPAAPRLVLPDFADIAERANPAVVGVTSTGEGTGRRVVPPDPFHWFYGPGPGQRLPERSMGSGFVISPDGYVFTNYHVVESASKIVVDLSDGKKLEAKLVGQDPETDLALLKVEPVDGLKTLLLGDSDAVRVGEWVCAIGNPLYYDHTVTVGVISAKGRILDGNSAFESYLQTDAAINFGNSGGPLLNLRGEVIGINTAISSQGQNIGFAIPINMAKDILPQLKAKGRVTRGYLGAYLGEIDEGKQKAFKLPSREGALINEVVAGEAGARAGLKPGDVIVEVSGEKVKGPDDLVKAISRRKPGDSVQLRVIRDGKEREIVTELGERKARQEGERRGAGPGDAERIGVSVADLDSRSRSMFRIGEDVEGVVVTGVDGEGPAADGSLRVGDVILEIDRKPVVGAAEVGGLLSRFKEGEDVLLYVLRDGIKFWVTVPAQGPGR